MAEEVKKERWYPGKLLNKAVRRASSTTTSTTRTSYDGRSSEGRTAAQEDDFDLREQSFVEYPSTDLPAVDFITSGSSWPYKVRVKILEQKYSRAVQTKYSVRVGSLKIGNILESQFPFERVFDLPDITCDVKIEAVGVSSMGAAFNSGVVYVPAVSLVGFTGAVLPVAATWREVYPFYDRSRRSDDLSAHKFVSGLAELPGSALHKPKFSMGFLLLEVELLAPQPSVLGLYLQPSLLSKDDTGTAAAGAEEAEVDPTDSSLALQQALVQRDLERLRAALFRVPPLITSFLYMPEVAVLIAVFGCVCFSIQAYQLPMTLFIVLLANGIMTASARSYANVVVWNDPGTPMGSATASASSAEDVAAVVAVPAAVALLRANQFVLAQVAFIVRELEVFHNILTFADARVSLIVYGFLLAVALVASLWVSLLSLSSLIFVTGSAVLLAVTLSSFLTEQAAMLSKDSIYYRSVQAVGTARATWLALRSRVPDELEMQHRFVAAGAVTKETAMLMVDAATDFAACPPGKTL